jgi:hypothetical protein
VNVRGFVQTDCVRLCAIKELALCLDLILRKVDLVHCVQITCPVRSLALWLCAQEKMHVRDCRLIKKKKKKLVDVAPHWGEPRISCVDVLCAMLLMLFMLFIY